MKINIKNEKAVSEAIKAAEGKATARRTTALDIMKTLNMVGRGIPKKKLSGTRVHYSGAEHFPLAYKHRPMSTHWVAENINGKWYVIDIYRDVCPNRYGWNTDIAYSETAKQAILKNAMYIRN